MEHLKNRILVVDDDPSVREMLTRVLVGEDYLVLPAASGPEALKIASATQIDLVLLDLNMPGQSGWDTFERLTAEDPLIPVTSSQPGPISFSPRWPPASELCWRSRSIFRSYSKLSATCSRNLPNPDSPGWQASLLNS